MNTLGLYDYSKLKGRIREQNLTQEDIAKEARINSTTLSLKLCGKGLFKQSEISAISETLGISPEDIGVYFFMT